MYFTPPEQPSPSREKKINAIITSKLYPALWHHELRFPVTSLALC